MKIALTLTLTLACFAPSLSNVRVQVKCGPPQPPKRIRVLVPVGSSVLGSSLGGVRVRVHVCVCVCVCVCGGEAHERTSASMMTNRL